MAKSKSDKMDRYCYIYSCDLHEKLQIKVGSLEGHNFLRNKYLLADDDVHAIVGNDLTITCQIVSGSQKLTLPVQTSYKHFTNRINWQEWLTMPIAYSHLPRNAEANFILYGLNKLGERYQCGQTTTPLFDKHMVLQNGMLDLKMISSLHDEHDATENTKDSADIENFAQLKKKHREGRLEKVDWLDRLSFKEIEQLNDDHKRVSKQMYLMVEFPHVSYGDVKFDVVYFEYGGDDVSIYEAVQPKTIYFDSTLSMTNLVEDKHHILARALRSGTTDRDLKPDTVTRDALNGIVSSPTTTVLTSEEQDLLWKYRYFISSQKMALTKFLRCVNWNNEQESKEAQELMHKWEPINVEDSLELLSPAFQEQAVRQYAVGRLMQADDDELMLYLLQLVQAIRYENIEEVKTSLDEQAVTAGVTQDILDEALADDEELDASGDGRDGGDDDMTVSRIPEFEDPADIQADLDSSMMHDMPPPGEMDIVSFLIYRASNNFTLANYLYWYLHVETEESPAQSEKSNEIFCVMSQRLIQSLKKHNPNFYNKIIAQQTFMGKLLQLTHMVATARVDRKKKIEKLQSLLTDTESFGKEFTFTSFQPFPLPLDPDRLVKAIVPDTAYLFKSALCPTKLTLVTTSEEQFTIIFKHGDDLRQDQLVLQMVHLMDKLLRKENLDLRLKHYRVLATSSKHGFIEFIPSLPVAEILQVNDGSILNYLKKHAPADNPQGISTHVMDNYIRSCAGFCVITYLLGVGDRHLDNLMLTPTGHLFHIDFGYILGRDPKPMPPPMKLTKEMVDAMGGYGSDHYKTFTDLCFSAFFHLRRSANLILNLFSLMVDANIPDIALEPDKTVKKVQDKFLLTLSDEEAAKEMQGLLEASVSALMPAISETIHRLAQYMRK